MTGRPVTAAAAQRTLLLLSATRWFPVGLVIGLITLLMLQRGLSLSQVGIAFAAQGFVVLALELPTGGLADALGRRPVLILAAVIAIVAAVVFVLAQSLRGLVLAWALQGIFRALDSGPLEAWYVDAAHADDPAVPVERALARAGTVLGLAIAGRCARSPAAWWPGPRSPGTSPLLLPFLLAIAVNVVHLVLTVGAGTGGPPGPGRVPPASGRPVGASGAGHGRPGHRAAPDRSGAAQPGAGRGVLERRHDRLRDLNPVRLAELVGGEERAGVIIGPVSAVSWGLFAAGAAVAGLASRRIGVAWTALLARVLNGAFVVLMGLAAGPVGLIAAFLAAYTLHGTAGPMHNTLLHRQAGTGEPGHRAVDELDGRRRRGQPRPAGPRPAGRAHLDGDGHRRRRRLQHPRCCALPPGPPPGARGRAGAELQPAEA